MTTHTARASRTWPAYASFGWLVVFVGWHAPMLFGWDPFDMGQPDSNIVVFLLYDAALLWMAALGSVVVLATVRPWGRRVPRWLLLFPLTFGSVLLTVRGGPGFVEFVAQVTGLAPAGLLGLVDKSVETPTGLELYVGYAINLYFFVGAVFLVPATVRFWRNSPDSGNALAGAGSDQSLFEG